MRRGVVRLRLALPVALAAPPSSGSRVNVGVRLGVAVATRAPPLRSLAGPRDPSSCPALDVLDVGHNIDVRRVDAPGDAAEVIAFEAWRDRPAYNLVDDPVSLPHLPVELDVPITPAVSRPDPLPTASDGDGHDLRGKLRRQVSPIRETGDDPRRALGNRGQVEAQTMPPVRV
jgi:hypothetical protein